MEDLNDNDLLGKIADKNEKAMEVFYHRFSTLVYRFSLRTLNTPMDASEVVNEVMMEVWKKAETFAGNSSVKTWLLSITHHKAVDLVRKNVRHDHESDDKIPEAEDPVCSFSLLDESESQKKYIAQCMSELSSAHKEVIHLAFFEDLSYPEISNLLDVAAGTIKTRAMHAKKKLLSCLSRVMSLN